MRSEGCVAASLGLIKVSIKALSNKTLEECVEVHNGEYTIIIYSGGFPLAV